MTTTIDVAAIQAKQYPEPRCWSLVSDVYMNMLRRDPLTVSSVTESIREASRTFSLQLTKEPNGLQQVADARELAIVLMWPTARRVQPHCGIVYQGKVLHATKQATLHQDLASLRSSYPVMEFWAYV